MPKSADLVGHALFVALRRVSRADYYLGVFIRNIHGYNWLIRRNKQHQQPQLDRFVRTKRLVSAIWKALNQKSKALHYSFDLKTPRHLFTETSDKIKEDAVTALNLTLISLQNLAKFFTKTGAYTSVATTESNKALQTVLDNAQRESIASNIEEALKNVKHLKQYFLMVTFKQEKAAAAASNTANATPSRQLRQRQSRKTSTPNKRTPRRSSPHKYHL
jgi:hypothetical protein